MMQHYNNHDIQELPLSAPYFRNKVVRFLGENGLRLEAVDSYYVIEDAEGRILAGAGLCADVVKCVAVAASARSEGLAAPLLSAVVSRASARGITCLKVFTKPENEGIFQSLGFRTLARAPQALLMENGRGLEQYCTKLRALAGSGKTGVIVMNANPFTLGHKYLIEKALETVRHLVVIPVMEDVSLFPYKERLEMICRGVTSISAGDVDVADGSPYAISAATFPTYFLKDLTDASETQMRLDLDLFARHIAPALGATVRFVGSEPADALTARYNALMKEILPGYGIEVYEVPRVEIPGHAGNDGEDETAKEILRFAQNDKGQAGKGGVVSATAVRAALEKGCFREASALTPKTTWPYLLAFLAHRALRLELDTPLKPGLVGPDGPGAHRDMDYATMLSGINALRPFWPRIACASSATELRELGIEAEKAMLAATGGVNTHRGAIFSLGLALNAAWLSCGRCTEVSVNEPVMQSKLGQIAELILRNRLDDNGLRATLPGVKDARQMAFGGYRELFDDWLPFYRSFGRRPQDDTAGPTEQNACHSAGPGHSEPLSCHSEPLSCHSEPLSCHSEPLSCHSERSEESPELLTLLRIMSTLDDTCVIKRAGYVRAQEVKAEAAALLKGILRYAQNDRGQSGHDGKDVMAGRNGHLQNLCSRYAAEGISPGGAADMLALTIFIDTLIL